MITTGLPISNGFDAHLGGTTPSSNRIDLVSGDDFAMAVQMATGTPPPQVLTTTFEYETRQALVLSFDQDASALRHARNTRS